jgi:hypothetical protein
VSLFSHPIVILNLFFFNKGYDLKEEYDEYGIFGLEDNLDKKGTKV